MMLSLRQWIKNNSFNVFVPSIRFPHDGDPIFVTQSWTVFENSVKKLITINPIKNHTVFSFTKSFEPQLAVRSNISKLSNGFEKTNFITPKNLTSLFKWPLPHQFTRSLSKVFKLMNRGHPVI